MKNEYFYSTDLYISAVLIASGFSLVRLDGSSERRVTFVFDDPLHVVEMTIRDYWNRKNILPSRNLIEAIHELKTRIYARGSKLTSKHNG